MKNELIIDNKGTYSHFGITIRSKEIGIPQKNKIKQSVPYMNGTYDFSLLYSEQTYSERELVYIFNIIGANKEEMNIKKIEFLNWIMDKRKQKLIDNSINAFYFLAEAKEASFTESRRHGELTVKFSAYPFKISTLQDGHDIWDNFNFELDMVQETKFEIENIKNIQLYNNGAIGINPIVICSNDMEIIKGTTTYKFNSGETKSWSFKLDKGLNDLIIKGTGTIEFKWYKEVL